VAFSADGRILASGGLHGKVRLWDPANGEPVATLEAQSGSMTSVAFSPDEPLLASAAVDGTTRLWDIRKRASISQLGIGVALLALG
jgi:WD40 repeat protein